MIKLRDLLSEIKLPFSKWVRASNEDLKQFREEIFDMIQKSYAYIGGHHDFTSPNDITTNEADYWVLADVDKDNDPDAILAAKTTKSGKKYVVGATDGSQSAKTLLMYTQISKLKQPGFYAEVSHKIADVLIANHVPIVNDEKTVRTVLNKDIKWVGTVLDHPGDGWYYRNINGQSVLKTLLGKPKK